MIDEAEGWRVLQEVLEERDREWWAEAADDLDEDRPSGDPAGRRGYPSRPGLRGRCDADLAGARIRDVAGTVIVTDARPGCLALF